jgi:hypothetical protein
LELCSGRPICFREQIGSKFVQFFAPLHPPCIIRVTDMLPVPDNYSLGNCPGIEVRQLRPQNRVPAIGKDFLLPPWRNGLARLLHKALPSTRQKSTGAQAGQTHTALATPWRHSRAVEQARGHTVLRLVWTILPGTD